MHQTHRSSLLFLLLTLLFFCIVPLQPLLYGGRLETPLLGLLCSLLVWVFLWALFGKPVRFFWLLLPAFLALPVEVLLFRDFRQHLSAHHLGIIIETSPAEALAFLGPKAWLAGSTLLLMLAWFGLAWRAAWRSPLLTWTGISRLPGLLVSGGALALLAAELAHAPSSSAPPVGRPALLAMPAAGWDTATVKKRIAGLPGWLGGFADQQVFARSWPFGVYQTGWNFYQERRYLASLAGLSSRFKFHARQQPPSTLAQTVVMVIGESSRYDRWSINGYARNTNPLLARESNLVTLSDFITGVSATRLSVPVIMSRKPTRQSLRATFEESSFISAYKEAGFKTWWLSNQMTFGKFDTPVSVYAEEADVRQFTNMGSITSNGNFDDQLLAPLAKAMQDPAPRKLIVLHTLGNHWNYSQRYPQSFDRWQPSLFGVERPAYTDLKLKTPINNSYDNSILYTDWFLAQVIDRLRAKAEQPGKAAAVTSMFYVADHGQTLYDGSCRLAFHGHNTQYEFHVPALAWYSDRYRSAYPAKVEQLLKHRNARLSTENVFHTLLDMADIHYPGEQASMSLLSPALKPHTRYVDSYGWTDYDDATLKGDCHEVIAKGRPQARN